MTSQPQPPPGEGRPAGQYLRPLRDWAAYVLVGAPAVLLFVAVIRLIPGDDDFGLRTQDSFHGFVNLSTIFLPFAGVLLALLIQPRHPQARLIVLVALVEYAVMAFFGVLFGFLFGVINLAGNNGARPAFEEMLVRLAWLAVFGLTAYAVLALWRGLFQVPRPQPQPGVYGRPQYNQPGTYPGQPGYGPPPGQPAYPPQQPGGYPQQSGGYPPPPGAPYGQPPAYGQPQQPPAWSQPAAPASAPPAGGTAAHPAPPASPHPAAAHPAPPAVTQPAPPAPVDPTRVVPAAEAGPDRTEKIPDDRPGFGPADEDPPRR